MNQSELAEVLGITRAAVAQWPDDKPIPQMRWFELKYKLRPEVFKGIPDPDYKTDSRGGLMLTLDAPRPSLFRSKRKYMHEIEFCLHYFELMEDLFRAVTLRAA